MSSAQDAKVTKSMAILKDQTAKLGAPKIDRSDLYFGSTKINNSSDVVGAVLKENGGAATLFVKAGDGYVRIATTLKKDDGSSAVGTTMDPKGPAIAQINNGEAYYGDATVLDQPYVAAYEPVKDASGT